MRGGQEKRPWERGLKVVPHWKMVGRLSIVCAPDADDESAILLSTDEWSDYPEEWLSEFAELVAARFNAPAPEQTVDVRKLEVARDVLDAWRSGERPEDYPELIDEAVLLFGGRQ